MRTNNNLATLVDDFGRLDAEIADLVIEQNKVKKQLVALGDGAYEGNLFRVSVSTAVRKTLNTKAVKAKLLALGVKAAWFKANTKETDVTTVKAVGRVGDNITLLAA